MLSQLDNVHIGKYYGRDTDCTCMLMEFLPNGTLFKVIEKGPLPLPVTKTIFRQLATTLDYIHQKGIAHGDIKPENILISEDYKIKICDFGFARVVSNNPQEAVGGSKGYTAPEIYKPLVEDLRKCDIFSLGVVLFIMMTGVMPFLNNIPEILDPWWSMLQKQDYNTFWLTLEQQCGVFPLEFKKVIEMMLTPDPQQRATIKTILEIPWLLTEFATEQEVQMEIQLRIQGQNNQKN